MIGKVPSEVAKHLSLSNASGFTFHLFRRSAATAVADVGATSEQMCHFLGWLNAKMAGEYTSISKAAVKTLQTSCLGLTVSSSIQVPADKWSSSTTGKILSKQQVIIN